MKTKGLPYCDEKTAMIKTALVVGASGFLGRALCTTLLSHSLEVSGTFQNNPEKVLPGVTAISLKQLISGAKKETSFDAIFLCAGSFSAKPSEMIETQIKLPLQISQLFPKAKLIFISSVDIYGTQPDCVTELTSSVNPSFYGLSKLAGETITMNHQKYAIVRLSYLYGSELKPGSMLSNFIQSAKTTGVISLRNQGERAQDYLHVADAAILCYLASQHEKNAIFLGATGVSSTNKAIATWIQKQIPNTKIVYEGYDTIATKKFDPSWTKKTLNWSPLHKLASSLQEMI